MTADLRLRQGESYKDYAARMAGAARAAELDRDTLADEVESLRAIKARAQGVIADGGPDETPTARYILNGRN